MRPSQPRSSAVKSPSELTVEGLRSGTLTDPAVALRGVTKRFEEFIEDTRAFELQFQDFFTQAKS